MFLFSSLQITPPFSPCPPKLQYAQIVYPTIVLTVNEAVLTGNLPVPPFTLGIARAGVLAFHTDTSGRTIQLAIVSHNAENSTVVGYLFTDIADHLGSFG